MKPFLITAGIAMAGLLASCGEPEYAERTEPVEIQAYEEPALAAEDTAAPTVAEVEQTPAPDAPVGTLPDETRSSEQSVQPDSDTLFY